MKFEEAIKLLKCGCRIRRKGWSNLDKYIHTDGKLIINHKGKAKSISYEQMCMDDWEIHKPSEVAVISIWETKSDEEQAKRLIKRVEKDVYWKGFNQGQNSSLNHNINLMRCQLNNSEIEMIKIFCIALLEMILILIGVWFFDLSSLFVIVQATLLVIIIVQATLLVIIFTEINLYN